MAPHGNKLYLFGGRGDEGLKGNTVQCLEMRSDDIKRFTQSKRNVIDEMIKI